MPFFRKRRGKRSFTYEEGEKERKNHRSKEHQQQQRIGKREGDEGVPDF